MELYRQRIKPGCLLHDLQRQAGNEAYEEEYRKQNLTAEHAALLVRLYELFLASRRSGLNHYDSVLAAYKSSINRELDLLQKNSEQG
jgi:hypothetical protein